MTPQHTAIDTTEAHPRAKHVNVTAIYTSTAADRHFVVDENQTVHHVILEAYAKLEESPRPGDTWYCQGEPRVDLAPYQATTLKQLAEQGRCLLRNERGELEFIFDIDTEPGGAH